MFGEMNVVPLVDLHGASGKAGGSLDSAVARLLELTEHAKIEKWIQFPKALFVFLLVEGDPESGAFYVFDRWLRVWYWVDFDDDKFGGYTVGDFERLLCECRFLDIVECPHLLRGPARWSIQPGDRPRELGQPASPGRFRIGSENLPGSLSERLAIASSTSASTRNAAYLTR
jgi:hypothetical protein